MSECDLPADPSPALGFVRLALLLERPATPGELARASACDPDDLGPIRIDGDQAFVDIRAEVAKEAREKLAAFGPIQLLSKAAIPVAVWRWMRLAVGRNHGMTIGQFKRIMQRSPATSLGKIHLNNSHTLVGIREELWEATRDYFQDQKINGINVRPSDPLPGETYDSPAYQPSKPPRMS